MDPFVDIFLQIDSDNSNTITTSDLEHYASKNNLDMGMVSKWTALFDPQNTGEITLAMFCDVLGLQPAEVISKREILIQRAGPQLRDDIHVIFANMSMADQVLISDETRKRVNQLTSDSDIQEMAEDLKRFLDGQLGPSWQVAVVDGGYWITHTYLPGTAFQFQLGERAYLFWKITE
ncbi:uncharacterized protein DEA37_0009480 [Paragonimus westermani]|uniref:Tegument antigen n=1 Tax=Paragonimus westermani TaxID=34504 RepID=A0A5J4NFX4_9TREM|nr:uncharacterized protein DEA37_0009480 [Paragonimus westermani]